MSANPLAVSAQSSLRSPVDFSTLTTAQLAGFFRLAAQYIDGNNPGAALPASDAYQLLRAATRVVGSTQCNVANPGGSQFYRVDRLQRGGAAAARLSDFTFPDIAWQKLLHTALNGQCGRQVLIEGAGHGVEVNSLAHALHRHFRSERTLTSVDLRKFTDAADIEEELFGTNESHGAFARAGYGTLIIHGVETLADEHELQARIVSALGTRSYLPSDSETAAQLQCQVILCTHEHLEPYVASGRIAADFTAQLQNSRLVIPPLHETPHRLCWEIGGLLSVKARDNALTYVGLTAEAEVALIERNWQGGVRALSKALDDAIARVRDNHGIDDQGGMVIMLDDLVEVLPDLAGAITTRNAVSTIVSLSGACLPPCEESEAENAPTLAFEPGYFVGEAVSAPTGEGAAPSAPSDGLGGAEGTEGEQTGSGDAGDRVEPDSEVDVAPPPDAPAASASTPSNEGVSEATATTQSVMTPALVLAKLEEVAAAWSAIFAKIDDTKIYTALRKRHDELGIQDFRREVFILSALCGHGKVSSIAKLRDCTLSTIIHSLEVVARHMQISKDLLLAALQMNQTVLPDALQSFDSVAWKRFSHAPRNLTPGAPFPTPWKKRGEVSGTFTPPTLERSVETSVKECVVHAIAVLHAFQAGGHPVVLLGKALTYEDYDDALVVYTYLFAHGDIQRATQCRAADDFQGRMVAVALSYVDEGEKLGEFLEKLTGYSHHWNRAEFSLPLAALTRESSLQIQAQLESGASLPAAPVVFSDPRVAAIDPAWSARITQAEKVLADVRDIISGNGGTTPPTIVEVEKAILVRMLVEYDWSKQGINGANALALIRSRVRPVQGALDTENGRLVQVAGLLGIKDPQDQNRIEQLNLDWLKVRAMEFRAKYPLCLGTTFSEQTPGKFDYRELKDVYIFAVAHILGESPRSGLTATCQALDISSPVALAARLVGRG